LHARIVRNPISLKTVEAHAREGRFALWIGKSDVVKRPDLLCNLASAAPDIPFIMLMNRSDPAVFERIVRSLPSNVSLVERLGLEEVEHLFLNAKVLINTSEFEGFPNAFLQAGKYSVPVLSLRVDPDGYLESFGCGLSAGGSEEELKAGLVRLGNNPALCARLGISHRAYVERHHRLKDRVAELEEVLVNVSTRV
jgi:glycosyltransferase involved in cell wall biosynthesis